MKYVVVLPFIVREYRDACLATCRLDNVLEVDNTVTNRGVMRSHNLGVDEMRRQDADLLIILSAAVRFGPAGGLDFVAEMERHPDAAMFNAIGLFGWHLMGFPRETVEVAGRWDENFHPYGFDDNDYAIRAHHARPSAPWIGIHVDADDRAVGMGHSVKEAGVRADANAQLDYFRKKWGDLPGPPFEAYYDRPFNHAENALGYWPPPRELGVVDGARWDQEAPR